VNEQPTSEPEVQVVVNDEEQYSIWPVDRELPAGWHAVGVRGTKERCLAHIREVWTDITPLSVRRALHAAKDAT
jgi:MbtH protein